MKRFCLLTTGRTASTAVMQVLEQFEDVAVPNKNIPCIDNELVHPERVRQHVELYSQLCKCPITTQAQLIETFYRCNAQYAYAGFKSMANRHSDYDRFTRRQDIKFITLFRKDVASTVASFMLAMENGTWRRSGGAPKSVWTFEPSKQKQVLSNLTYIFNSVQQLLQVPSAIRLYYEDLCRPDFVAEDLNCFFQREIKLAHPLPPTFGASYVRNWDVFQKIINYAWQKLLERNC